MDIELRSTSSEVALRNEEINRQRMQQRGAGSGPLKITDPAAFQKLMADMKLKAEQQQQAERQREEERARREGSAYKSKEERAREARDAKEQTQAENEARTLDTGKFDPSRDYYSVLEVDRSASSAELRKAYKRFALLYHPDKHKGEGEEQQAAIAERFRVVQDAFDVLVDEERRALYDKIRDYKETNPGKGLPPLSPEEAAMMQSGIAELSRLRRQGPKLAKHPPLEKEVWVSLPKLNTGCTKSISVERRRLNYAGIPTTISKTFHLVIRKASREGQRLVFEGEGEEMVDTEAGDIIFTLRGKPDPSFRRSGVKDLEMFAATVPPGDVLFAVELTTMSGLTRLLHGSALATALANGGMGGEWQTVLQGQGLFDPDNPWEKPPGNLTVKLRYPPVLLSEKVVVSCLRPRPVYMVGSADNIAAAALAAGQLAATLRHTAEAQHLMMDSIGPYPITRVTCLSIFPTALYATSTDPGQRQCSPAAATVLQVLKASVPGLIAQHAFLGEHQGLLDDAWINLHQSQVIILDLRTLVASSPAEQEAAIATACRMMILQACSELIWKSAWRGCHVMGIGAACALLGRSRVQGLELSSPSHLPVLPHYHVRAGGGVQGWSTVCAGMTAAPSPPCTWVGVMQGSVATVNPVTGQCELIAAPPRQVLMDTGAWRAAAGGGRWPYGVDETDDDYGYFAAWEVN